METDEIAQQLNLQQILKKASENFGWSDEQAAHALHWYLRHWRLAALYPTTPLAAISKAADDLWHQHMLDSRKYEIDCHKILGAYMHHQPIYGQPSRFEAAAYEETLDLYAREFGETPSDKGQTSGNYSYRA